MITPDSPDRQYSTRRRTALVLTGSGTAGAYHAGVLRALPEVRELYRRIVTEIVAIGRAAGAPVDDGLLEQGMKFLEGVAPNAYSSLHHDLTQGKRLELEALHGHAVRLAERHGVPAPTVFAVYAALLPYRDGPPRL